MILFNKGIDKQDVVLTLSELTTIVNPVYLLLITSDFTKTVTRLHLATNLSKNLNRYDYFQIDTSLIGSLEPGLYTYAVYQSATATNDESTLGNPIESGKATVIAPGAVMQPIIYDSAPTEYVTFNND